MVHCVRPTSNLGLFQSLLLLQPIASFPFGVQFMKSSIKLCPRLGVVLGLALFFFASAGVSLGGDFFIPCHPAFASDSFTLILSLLITLVQTPLLSLREPNNSFIYLLQLNIPCFFISNIASTGVPGLATASIILKFHTKVLLCSAGGSCLLRSNFLLTARSKS